MKNFTFLFLAVALSAASAAADPGVVFLKSGAAGDGATAETPFGTMSECFAALGDEGGTIVLCGEFAQDANYPVSGKPHLHAGNVTITSVYGGVDYRDSGAQWLLNKGYRFQLGGPTAIENVHVKCTAAKNNFLLLICNYYPLTMGEGVTNEGFTFSAVANSITVLGGCQDNLNNKNPDSNDPTVTINGGEVLICGFDRGAAKNFGNTTSPGTSHITVNGGKIHNVFCGSVAEGLRGGSVDVNIAGGQIVGAVYLSKMGGNVAAGPNISLTVTGGDFSQCQNLVMEKYDSSQNLTVDIKRAGDSEFDALMHLRYPQYIDGFISNYLLPVKAMVPGEEFTASNGINIPYCIYIPENVPADKKLPLVLFMHDNGSRGNDNVTQLVTAGAISLVPLLNYEPAIVVAPQCIEESAWILPGKYPGNPDYSLSEGKSPYLQAATELLDHIVATENVDATRLYVAGSSNGAGATWDFIVRHPGKFAAAIPVAGCGDGSKTDGLGELIAQTPVWTFHGDADATLDISGTRALADAAQAAGAKDFTFTEIPGANHGTVWRIAASTPGFAEWMFSHKLNSASVGDIVADNDRIAISVNGDAVNVTTGTDGVAKIYNAAGAKVADDKCAAGANILHVAGPGVYVVSVITPFASKVDKIIVK